MYDPEYEKLIAMGEDGDEGCYVATCAYGSYDCPQVWVLRRYRDNFLKKTAAGRRFVRFYYSVSPGLVRRFGGVCWLRRLARAALGPFRKPAFRPRLCRHAL